MMEMLYMHLYIWLYGVGRMVKYHRDNKRGNTSKAFLWLFFLINTKESFICIIPEAGLHIPMHVTPVTEQWLERLTARVLLYAPSHRHDNTYHGL